MKYDFDTITPRENTDSMSVDKMKALAGRDDLIPLWVADMAFPTPPFVIRAIENKLRQKILGYTCASEAYYKSVMEWNGLRHGFHFPREAVHFIAGIVPSVYSAVNCLTEKGDGVMILTPVYHPFGNVARGSGRKVVEVPLLVGGERFQMDFEAIERKLPLCKMLVFCNPHNPGGTSWTADEIAILARLCKKHRVWLLSDEIHADMTFPPNSHTPTAVTCDEAADVTLTFMSPTKAFNLPGVITAYAVALNPELREKYFGYIEDNDICLGNVFAYDATKACYSDEGAEWLEQMMAYVAGNIDYITDFLAANCPKIKPVRPEASYLVFLDNRGLNLSSQRELADFYISDAGLFLNSGTLFGAPGEGFMRLNAGQPRSIIRKAMRQLAEAYRRRGF